MQPNSSKNLYTSNKMNEKHPHNKNVPTPEQCHQFHEVTGHPYPPNTTKGTFKTKKPYNDTEWKLSPWWVRYIFHEDTGHLFCQLSHRMTNNRCHGWDKAGEELPFEQINRVYPAGF